MRNRVQGQADPKPQGLWYSIGHEWAEWCHNNHYRMVYYRTELFIPPNKILHLKSGKDIDWFGKKYASRYPYRWNINREDEIYHIDWSKVAKEYSGIQISPYIWSRRLSSANWYYGWDVASGCIWDTSVIKVHESLSCNEQGNVSK